MPENRLPGDLQRYLEAHGPRPAADDPPPSCPPSPSDRDLVRLGQLLGLNLSQAVVLVLKGQWEKFRDQRGTTGDSQGHSVAARYPLNQAFHAGACGTADASGLFRLFEEEARLSSDGGHDEESFRTLVHHCTLLGLHLRSFHGPEVQAFDASQQAQQELLVAATPEEREAFWTKHRQWREMEEEVGSLLLEVEGQALENRRIERQWMETFGSAYLPLLETEARFRSLVRAIESKAANPHLTLEDLEELETVERESVEQEMARLRRTLARSRVAHLSGPGGMPLHDFESLGYEEECRRLLREIYRLTHPDIVRHHGFTERQRERLVGYYRAAVACADTTRLDDQEIALGMRSLPSLEGILTRVRKIWEVKGLDVNEGAAIRGETLAERMAWLTARNAELEEQATQVRGDLLVIATDADLGEKRACLRSREQIAGVTWEMEQKRQDYAAQIPALEVRLQQLFEGGSESDPTLP
ncbi:MAG: hypothetical protein P1P84_09120 [Deferrisomatales bacterium]|nr:hypothetical protein [Deferrisomatales bacterium]